MPTLCEVGEQEGLSLCVEARHAKPGVSQRCVIVRLRILAEARMTTAGQSSLSAALRAKAGRSGGTRTPDPLIKSQLL